MQNITELLFCFTINWHCMTQIWNYVWEWHTVEHSLISKRTKHLERCEHIEGIKKDKEVDLPRSRITKDKEKKKTKVIDTDTDCKDWRKKNSVYSDKETQWKLISVANKTWHSLLWILCEEVWNFVFTPLSSFCILNRKIESKIDG